MKYNMECSLRSKTTLANGVRKFDKVVNRKSHLALFSFTSKLIYGAGSVLWKLSRSLPP
jgi:hypothetical protein